MKTGLLIITAFYLVITIFVIISHLLRGSSSTYRASIIRAITSQDPGTLKTLLQNKVDLEVKDERYKFMTPLMIAAGTGNLEIVKILVDHNADMNTTRYDHTTALFYAITGNHLETAKWLVENGAYPNQSDNKGSTPLILALLMDDEPFARYLIEHGADVYAVNAVDLGMSYFTSTSTYNYWLTGKKNTEEIINREKASVMAISLYVDQVFGQRDENEFFWKPPLWYGVENDSSDLFNLLWKHNPEINWVLDYKYGGYMNEYVKGMNILMYASYRGNVDIMKILMEAGLDLNVRDEEDRNALYYAIQGKSVEAVKLLFNAGIDQLAVKKEYNDGETALQVASYTKGADEITKTLKELGAMKSPPKKKKVPIRER